MAGPELPNSSLTDSRYFTINEIRMLCSALRHMDAVWRLGGRECLQVHFFSGCWGAGWPQLPLGGSGFRCCGKCCCDYPGTVAVSPVLHTCLSALPLPFVAFSLRSAGIAVGFYGNGETSDGIHRLTYSLRHANRTVAGVQDRVSTAPRGLWQRAASLSTSPLESGCACASSCFLFVSGLRDVLKFPLVAGWFLPLF